MSPFVIFAISLTIAYVIYYAVMITRDLYGKKEENKSNEEVFDVSSITEEEAAVAVNESDDSSHAGSNDSGVGAGGMTADGDDANQQKKTAAESLQEQVSDQMENTSPIWINGLWQDEFTESLLRQGETKPGQPNIKTIPIKDEI